MFHRVYRLQICPILEPPNLVRRDPTAERFIDVIIYLLPGLGRESLGPLVVC